MGPDHREHGGTRISKQKHPPSGQFFLSSLICQSWIGGQDLGTFSKAENVTSIFGINQGHFEKAGRNFEHQTPYAVQLGHYLCAFERRCKGGYPTNFCSGFFKPRNPCWLWFETKNSHPNQDLDRSMFTCMLHWIMKKTNLALRIQVCPRKGIEPRILF